MPYKIEKSLVAFCNKGTEMYQRSSVGGVGIFGEELNGTGDIALHNGL